MTHQVLLVSNDARLAARVRRALPGTVPIELHVAASYLPAPDPRGWLLILLDVLLAAALGALDAAPDPAPLLWLGAQPRVTETPGRLPAFAAHIVDYLDRDEAPSKLAFILHQHLAAGYLHRMRALPPPAAAAGGDELRRQLNNALTGILGNAALAMDAGRRLPPPLGVRLQRISDLAAQMRDLMRALPDPQSSKTPA